VHATMRVVRGVRVLRSDAVFRRLQASIKRASRGGFRVVQFSVQPDHVHLLVEAKDKRALAAGLRGLAVRIARDVNAILGRKGTLFPQRYHARALTRPREVRHCLLYVLANHRKHGSSAAWLDPRSSAAWFDGWRKDELFALAQRDVTDLVRLPPPVAPPHTWLASIGWRKHRLLGIDEHPR
jgi:putative transposase